MRDGACLVLRLLERVEGNKGKQSEDSQDDPPDRATRPRVGAGGDVLAANGTSGRVLVDLRSAGRAKDRVGFELVVGRSLEIFRFVILFVSRFVLPLVFGHDRFLHCSLSRIMKLKTGLDTGFPQGGRS